MQAELEITGNESEVIDSPVIEDAVDTNENTEVSEDVVEDTEDGVSDDVDKEMKTIKKALNKKNRYIDNQRSKIRALEAQMQELRSQTQNKQPAPQMEKFDSVLDYMKAEQLYNLDEKLAEQAQKQQLDYLQSQQEALRGQQAQAMAETMTELLTSNPDVKTVITQNTHIIQNMPPHIESLMYEINDAPAATYALAKEGRLQDLYFMPPHLAAAHLVQAEIRGAQYLQQSARPKTQAPEPIGSLKGAGKSSTKQLHQMTPSELDKWRKS